MGQSVNVGNRDHGVIVNAAVEIGYPIVELVDTCVVLAP